MIYQLASAVHGHFPIEFWKLIEKMIIHDTIFSLRGKYCKRL